MDQGTSKYQKNLLQLATETQDKSRELCFKKSGVHNGYKGALQLFCKGVGVCLVSLFVLNHFMNIKLKTYN